MSSTILSISEFKERFDPILTREFERHVARATLFTKDPDCGALLEHVGKIALAGGKRIRPYVAYLMYGTAGGEDTEVLETLAAFEIFHTFALIHDDIIDRGSLRHGQSTLHEFARSFVSGSPKKVEHLAEGLALLVGDLAFNWSRETFLRSEPSTETRQLFDDMVYAVVLGQMLDVKMMCQENPPEALIREKTSLKTAEYTFVYPMRVGASLADSLAEYGDWCGDVGLSLGMAFQVQDDLLDIIGEKHATGKNTLQDVVEGQHTLFSAYVFAHATDEDSTKFKAVFGHPLDHERLSEVKDIFERSGALTYGKEIITNEIAKARQLLTIIPEASEARMAWENLVTLLEKRTA